MFNGGLMNRGKQFENKFKNDFLKISGSVVERLPDQMSGYSGSKNVCDYLCYVYPNIYYIECKVTQSNTLPFVNISQYDELLERQGKKGIRAGVIAWFQKHDRVCYIPVKTIEKMKSDNKKSINIKMLDSNEYRLIEIPSIKKRIFLNSDYSVLLDLHEGD